MKTYYDLVNNNGKSIRIESAKLLRWMYQASNDFILTNRDAEREKEGFAIGKPADWLDLVGHLYPYITGHDIGSNSESWLPMDLTVCSNTIAPHISSDSIVKFPDNNDSYMQITQVILDILDRTHLNHSEFATLLLSYLSQKTCPENLINKINEQKKEIMQKDRDFIATLLVLLFGVEVSRNNTTLLSSLMLLDLIQAKQIYGTRRQHFDWHCAFVSRYDYCWDDAEHNNYGGKYPMSQLSTGAGNLGKGKSFNREQGVLMYGRGNFVASSYENTEDQLKKYPQRHAVPRREISLAVHWLESLTSKHINVLKSAKNIKALKVQIKALFTIRLEDAYLKPNTDATRWLISEPNQQPQPLSILHTKDTLSLFSRIKLKHQPEGSFNTFHRLDIVCKLIPGWVGEHEQKNIYKGDNVTKKMKSDFSGFLRANTAKEQNKCLYCYSRPIKEKQALPSDTPNVAFVIINDNKIHQPKFKACKQSSNLGLTIKENFDTGKLARLMFFGDAKKKNLELCKTCFVEDNVDDITQGIDKLTK